MPGCPAERLYSLTKIVNLAGAENLGMAGQDLFDQRRPRPRHADNEHRDGGRLALTLTAAHKFVRERSPRALQDV